MLLQVLEIILFRLRVSYDYREKSFPNKNYIFGETECRIDCKGCRRRVSSLYFDQNPDTLAIEYINDAGDSYLEKTDAISKLDIASCNENKEKRTLLTPRVDLTSVENNQLKCLNNGDEFALKLSGTLLINEPSNYCFKLSSDDGSIMNLWRAKIDNSNHPYQAKTAWSSPGTKPTKYLEKVSSANSQLEMPVDVYSDWRTQVSWQMTPEPTTKSSADGWGYLVFRHEGSDLQDIRNFMPESNIANIKSISNDGRISNSNAFYALGQKYVGSTGQEFPLELIYLGQESNIKVNNLRPGSVYYFLVYYYELYGNDYRYSQEPFTIVQSVCDSHQVVEKGDTIQTRFLLPNPVAKIIDEDLKSQATQDIYLSDDVYPMDGKNAFEFSYFQKNSNLLKPYWSNKTSALVYNIKELNSGLLPENNRILTFSVGDSTGSMGSRIKTDTGIDQVADIKCYVGTSSKNNFYLDDKSLHAIKFQVFDINEAQATALQDQSSFTSLTYTGESQESPLFRILNDGEHPIQAAFSNNIYLQEGFYSFVIDYFEKVGGEHLKLEWAKVAAATNCDSSLSYQLVPSSAFMLPEQDDFLYPPY